MHSKTSNAIAALAALALFIFPAKASDSETMSELSAALRAMPCYADSVSYDVLLATVSEPVSYKIYLQADTAGTDTLAPCPYIIDWQLSSKGNSGDGFNAYAAGSHFRYRDTRLQEYHAAESMVPFAPTGRAADGVQNIAQFTDLLPAFIARQLEGMQTDTTYTYTVSRNDKTIRVKGVRRYAGFDAAEFNYTFDAATWRPIAIDLETNPGQMGEQSIAIRYKGLEKGAEACPLTSAAIADLHADVFEKYRRSTYSLEELPGTPLPQISAPTLGSDRYYHRRGTALPAPSAFVFLDASIDTTPVVIEAVREAVAALPMQLDIVWAFVNNRTAEVSGVMTAAEPGETTILNAGSAARQCGVGALLPVIVFADSQGFVRDFIAGYNQDLRSVVIQKASLLGL